MRAAQRVGHRCQLGGSVLCNRDAAARLSARLPQVDDLVVQPAEVAEEARRSTTEVVDRLRLVPADDTQLGMSKQAADELGRGGREVLRIVDDHGVPQRLQLVAQDFGDKLRGREALAPGQRHDLLVLV